MITATVLRAALEDTSAWRALSGVIGPSADVVLSELASQAAGRLRERPEDTTVPLKGLAVRMLLSLSFTPASDATLVQRMREPEDEVVRTRADLAVRGLIERAHIEDDTDPDAGEKWTVTDRGAAAARAIREDM